MRGCQPCAAATGASHASLAAGSARRQAQRQRVGFLSAPLRFDVKRASSMEVPAVLWLYGCRRGNDRTRGGREKRGTGCAA
jgi:hypothetical protein